MIEQSQLMEILQYLSSEKSLVNLYNTYHGLPLDSDTAILGVDQGKVTTSVFGYQAVSMAQSGLTYMKIPSLPGALRAMVVNVDIRKKQAVLTDFSEVDSSIGRRRLIRVEPSQTLEVRIYDGRQHISGRVVDISIEGMCIYTFFAELYGLKFEHDKEVFIDFKPPDTKIMVRFKGIITSISGQEGTFQHRLGVKIYPGPELKQLLDDYIQRRQNELLKEMEHGYLLLSKKKSRWV